jgi:hypothetical protein
MQTDDRLAAIFAANANGVNPGAFTRRAHEIMAPALAAAKDTSHAGTPPNAEFAKYVGAYSEMPWGGEVAVLPWKGSLAMLYLPTDDPLGDLTELKHVRDHTFRRIRKDKALGEEIRFDVGPDGRATRVWQHSNFSPRMR